MKTVFTMAMLLCSIMVFSQEEEPTEKKFTISGSVDAYYKTNLTGPNEAFGEGDGTFYLNPRTSFADRSGFSLGMANAIISYEGEKVGFVADLVFGPRGEAAVFNSIGSSNIVNQLFVYYNISESVKLTFGNFNTYLGYEVISPAGNFNYSTSYMFSNGPFSHTGLKADIALSDDFSLMLAVMNSTDYTDFNLEGKYTAGAQLGYNGQYLNLLYGDQTGNSEATFQIDYTGGTDLSEDFFLGINATYNDTDGNGFYGAALYPQYSISEDFALGLRGEYFSFTSDNDDAEESVLAFTLSGNYKVENLTIIPELRLDSSDQEVFFDNDLEGSKSLASFLIAAVYSF